MIDRCVICGRPLGRFGNNPWPVKDTGECCDDCNITTVIPARLRLAIDETPYETPYQEAE